MKSYIFHGLMAVALGGFMLTSCNDDDVDIYTAPIVSEVSTGDAQTTATTATILGSASDLSSQSADAYTVGVVYSVTPTPTAGGTSVAGVMLEGTEFQTVIEGLQEGRTYYYAAFVTLQNRLTYYGEVKSFVTTSSQAGTADAASVSATGANLGGTLNGVSDLIEGGTLEYGVKLAGDASSVTTGQLLTPESTSNSYSVGVDKLVPNTTYYYAAYMNVGGEAIYGETKSFTTSKLCDAAEESADDYVDMGTVKEWCRYNVGAPAEYASGALMGYGDLKGLNRSVNVGDYATGSISNTEADPAVAAGMGFLPTADDFAELLGVCDVTSGEENGVKGAVLTSRLTGNKLFFPYDGVREGEETTEAGVLGLYATGSDYENHGEYIHAAKLSDGSATMELASRASGLSVRPVRKPFSLAIEVDNSKIAVGDLENKGNLRIEIYNEYGATGADAPLNKAKLSYSQGMYVTFDITGISNNLKSGAAGSYKAGLQYAADGWWPGRWSGYTNEKYDCLVTGDGTYTVWYAAEGEANGTVVFCVDIAGLANDIEDMSKVTVNVHPIVLDPSTPQFQTIAVDNTKVLFNNKDGNGVDGRIEIYNEYGDSKGLGADYSWLAFPAGTMTVTFKITGIDGNLKDSSLEQKGDISYATSSWYPSYWGGQVGTVNVTADGTYNTQCWLEADCTGAVVWAVELYNLWANLIDPDKVKVEIVEVTVPAYLN